MSKEIKEETGVSYGGEVAKNQALFDREMAEVLDANDFNNLYARLMNLYIIRMYDIAESSVLFSKEQTAKVVGWSRDLFRSRGLNNNKQAPIEDKEKDSVDKALLALVRLGSRHITMSEEDLEYCLCHANNHIKHYLCWGFDLTEHHIDVVIDSSKDEGGELKLPGMIDKYAKCLTPAQIEKIQLNGTVYDCGAIWFEGIGDSPIEKLPGMSKTDFISTCYDEGFALWRANYKARIESEKLKNLSVVSELGKTGKVGVMLRSYTAL